MLPNQPWNRKNRETNHDKHCTNSQPCANTSLIIISHQVVRLVQWWIREQCCKRERGCQIDVFNSSYLSLTTGTVHRWTQASWMRTPWSKPWMLLNLVFRIFKMVVVVGSFRAHVRVIESESSVKVRGKQVTGSGSHSATYPSYRIWHLDLSKFSLSTTTMMFSSGRRLFKF